MTAIAITATEIAPIEKLIPYPGNPRVGNLPAIIESLKLHGQFRALVVNRPTMRVVVGNHTLLGMIELGATEALVSYISVSEADEKRIVLVDNRTGDLATYDERALVDLLRSLADTDTVEFEGSGPANLGGTGFDDEALADLLRRVGEDLAPTILPTVEDGDLSVPAEPVTKDGDLWLLGEHRLLCGDATQQRDYVQVLGGAAPECVLTDPPYGVGIGAKNRALNEIHRSGRMTADLAGDTGVAEADALWRASFPCIYESLPPGGSYYVFGPQGGDLGLLLLALRDSGIAARHILIWVKNQPSFSMGRLDYDYAHEPIAYGWKPGAAHRWHAIAPQKSTLEYPRPSRSPEHATPKPVALCASLIRNSTKRGDWVLDPFAGSGSTGIAAHYEARRAALIEISPGYCDVICRRFQEHTGIVPVLEATGEAHDFTAAIDG